MGLDAFVSTGVFAPNVPCCVTKSFVASGALRGSSNANLRELQQREIALGAAP
jgi:hypothetical protein